VRQPAAPCGMMTLVLRLVLVVVLALVAAVAALLLLRPDAATVSSVDPQVTIECTGATAVDEEACRTWGDAILAEGSPSTTFEAEDLVRLRLDRAFLGFGATCHAEWFLGRYPADVVWDEEVTCAGREFGGEPRPSDERQAPKLLGSAPT
jgi:hypothetical protein